MYSPPLPPPLLDAKITPSVLDDLYTMATTASTGGMYPVGASGTWHGGVHLDPLDPPIVVRACAPGRIVAARLSPYGMDADGSEEQAGLVEYGHRNFILTKHTWPPGASTESEGGTDYFILYMHLDDRAPESYVDPTSEIPWLSRTRHLRVTEPNGVILRANPGGAAVEGGSTVTVTTPHGDRRKGLPPGALVVPIGDPVDRAGAQWQRVTPLDGGPDGYLNVEEIEEAGSPPVGDKALRALKQGKIATLNAPVDAGTPLWWSGEYGMELSDFEWIMEEAGEAVGLNRYVDRAPTVHWEVFSETPAFGLEESSSEEASGNGPRSNGSQSSTGDGESSSSTDRAQLPSWTAVEDTDDDLVVDPEGGQAGDVLDGLLEAVPRSTDTDYIDWPLGQKQGLHFTDEGKKLRSYAVKFPSEWGIDQVDKALEESVAHSVRDKEAYEEMLWWKHVDDVPYSANVWHYHPVTAMKALRAKAEAYLTNENTLKRGVTSPEVEALQEDLIEFGFDVGPIDGHYGAATEGAVVCLQVETYYHVVDGRLDPQDAFGKTEEQWIQRWYIDGIVGPGTKEAMRGWLDQELTAEYPREINVAKKHPEEPTGFIILDRENCDGAVYHYQSGVDGDQEWRDEIEWWGQPPIVYTLERVCRKWAELDNPSIQIGDMCRPQGGTYWEFDGEEVTETNEGWTKVAGNLVEASGPCDYCEERNGTWYSLDHASHDRGTYADIRPMVGTEDEIGTSYNADPSIYSRENSRTFLGLLESEAPKSNGTCLVDEILFTDSEIDWFKYSFRGRQVRGHMNHYHVKFINM